MVYCILVSKNGENVCDCGGYVVQCGSCNVEIGKILCDCGESEVRLRRFPYVIQVIARLFSAKTLCGNCKNVCDFGECVVVCGDLYVLFR